MKYVRHPAGIIYFRWSVGFAGYEFSAVNHVAGKDFQGVGNQVFYCHVKVNFAGQKTGCLPPTRDNSTGKAYIIDCGFAHVSYVSHKVVLAILSITLTAFSLPIKKAVRVKF